MGVSRLFIGTVIELMQKALGGRTVDPGDVYRDLLGCVAAFIFTGGGVENTEPV